MKVVCPKFDCEGRSSCFHATEHEDSTGAFCKDCRVDGVGCPDCVAVPDENKDYKVLHDVLEMAYEQASCGKGKERHANDLPFEEQPIIIIQRLLKGHPYAGAAFQVIKKIVEGGRLSPEAAEREWLGAINYTASMVHLNKDRIEK